MVDSVVPKAGIVPAPPRVVLGRERLLGLKLHSRLFVIESSFFEYLHELEVSDPCSL